MNSPIKEQVFIAYKHSDVDHRELQQMLESVSDFLKKLGYDSFIYWRDRQNWQLDTGQEPEEIISEALEEIDKSQVFLAIVSSDELSEGLIIEATKALLNGIRVIVAVADGVSDKTMKYTRSQVNEILYTPGDQNKDLFRAVKEVLIGAVL